MSTFKEKFFATSPHLLDGAMGSELERRGVSFESPLWSGTALLTHPQLVKTISRENIASGATIISTNTFRTNARTLRNHPSITSREATLLACSLAREARAETSSPDTLIAGSVGPVEECYSPTLVPPDETLRSEHRLHIESLIEGKVDLVLFETMNTIREAKVCAELAHEIGAPYGISFACTPAGVLLSGETLPDAVREITPYEPLFLGTNCQPPDTIETSLKILLDASPVPVAVYANGAHFGNHPSTWKVDPQIAAERYADFAKEWLTMGAAIIGGCCGTTPEYISRARRLSNSREAPNTS